MASPRYAEAEAERRVALGFMRERRSRAGVALHTSPSCMTLKDAPQERQVSRLRRRMVSMSC